MIDDGWEDKMCECGHYQSSHIPGGCQSKKEKSCHAWGCDCQKFKKEKE